MSRREDIEKLLTVHERRLQLLKLRQAQEGIQVDPGVIIEIESIEAELASLQEELQPLKSPSGQEAKARSTQQEKSDPSASNHPDNVIASGPGSVAFVGNLIGGAIITSEVNVYPAAARAMDEATLSAAQDKLAALPIDVIPEPAVLPSGSRMPHKQNPLFVGREAELYALAQMVKQHKTVVIHQKDLSARLGKTQLATEFVHLYGPYFAGGVFWLNFANPEAIPDEIAACGGPGRLNLHSDFNHLPLDKRLDLVYSAWQMPLPRLLAFDQCEDDLLLHRWQPTSGGCRILVTSRRSVWNPVLEVQLLELDVLPRWDSLMLLRKFRDDLSFDDPDLNSIAAELGDLPEALTRAGAYLRRYRHHQTPADYLKQLRMPKQNSEER